MCLHDSLVAWRYDGSGSICIYYHNTDKYSAFFMLIDRHANACWWGAGHHVGGQGNSSCNVRLRSVCCLLIEISVSMFSSKSLNLLSQEWTLGWRLHSLVKLSSGSVLEVMGETIAGLFVSDYREIIAFPSVTDYQDFIANPSVLTIVISICRSLCLWLLWNYSRFFFHWLTIARPSQAYCHWLTSTAQSQVLLSC